MARDIEEFLRRAAERRQQQRAQQGQPRKPAAPVPDEVEVEIVEPRIVQASSRRKDVVRPVAKNRPPTQADSRKSSVTDHVQQHINTNQIARHAEQLGDRIAGASQRIDADIHRRLDHDISQIDDRPTITDDVRTSVAKHVSPIADELLRMLSSPTSIRQAILVREVLDRPKWDDEDESEANNSL
jgi:hypothetical protein